MRHKLLRSLIALALCVLWYIPVQAAIEASSDADANAVQAPDPVELKIGNRSVFVFRGALLGETPANRAKRATASIADALQSDDDLTVRIDPIQSSFLVLLGYNRAFIVSPSDVGSPERSVRDLAEQAASNLRLVVTENGEARSLKFLATLTGQRVRSLPMSRHTFT